MGNSNGYVLTKLYFSCIYHYPCSMDLIMQLLSFILHLDQHLAILIANMGLWTYVMLFVIVFAETGLVVTPFLPGDSLLFAAGSLSAITILEPHVLVPLLITAAFLGNLVNYLIGRWLGQHLFRNPQSKIFNKKYLDKAHVFYEKYGGIAVTVSRFVPVIRTFVPFVAGMAKMIYSRFMLFNALGAVLWVGLISYAGYFFGQISWVKQHFSTVVLVIIAVSLLPIVIAWLKTRLNH